MKFWFTQLSYLFRRLTLNCVNFQFSTIQIFQFKIAAKSGDPVKSYGKILP